MTKRAAITQAQIARAIRALQKAGLTVKGVAADGTVLVDSGADSDTLKPETETRTGWSDDAD